VCVVFSLDDEINLEFPVRESFVMNSKVNAISENSSLRGGQPVGLPFPVNPLENCFAFMVNYKLTPLLCLLCSLPH
jgi:hypothetical protein